jgi:hypothetical protein
MGLRRAGGGDFVRFLGLEAPAAAPALHTEVLLFTCLRWHIEQADATVERPLELPIFAVEGASGAVTPPVNVILNDYTPFARPADALVQPTIPDCTTAQKTVTTAYRSDISIDEEMSGDCRPIIASSTRRWSDV